MKTSESLANLGIALAKAQGELKAVHKDSTNPHFRNTYASLDTILEAVRPTLAKHGLSLVQGATAPHADENGVVRSFVVETMLLHASGEYIINAAVMPLAKADPQGSGGAMTYGRRYGVSALLALATDEDDDGNGASARPAAPARAAAPAPAQPRPAAPAKPAAPGPRAIADVIQEVEEGLGGSVEPSCPTCQGPMWDNRVGKKNPKAPDFKCKDKTCDGVIWPPKNGKAHAKPSSSAAVRGSPAAHEPPNFDDFPPPTDDDLPF